MLKAIYTPGHDWSCMTYYTDEIIFTGDSYIPNIKVITSFPKSNKEDANFLVETLENVGINARVVSRSKGEVVYIKKAEQIGDFLRYTGAFNSLFFFEDQRIKRDYNNYANRMINCDIANEEKEMNNVFDKLRVHLNSWK